MQDVSEHFRGSGFKVFARMLEDSKNQVWAIPAPGGGSRAFCDRMNSWAQGEGQPGLGYIMWREGGEGAGPLANNIGPERTAALRDALGLKEGDAAFFVAGDPDKFWKFSGLARTRLGEELELIDRDRFELAWIVDFPMYEHNEEEKKIDFSHNPFSMPQGGLEALQTQDPLTIKAFQYDVTCNGYEIASGGIRNHQPAGKRMSSYSEDLHSAALAYHRFPKPGKLEIQAIKPLANQRDLALAYSPGVAAACTAIAESPAEAASLTTRANLVAVVSNGTAVLGLGNIGPLASKPVMEGKAVLFKKFAGIDVFDIEIAADTIERVVETVAALEPTFGGINLEDIKGPEAFEIEAQLKARMKIPVFHDDQHGTAIIVGAAIVNALLLNGKKLADVKIICSGAGAAAIACLNLLVSLGAQRKNIWVCDIDGVVHEGRNTLMDRWKAVYAQKTSARVLADVIGGADIFLGVSAPNVLTSDMVKSMANQPLVMALANPNPEIMPDEARKARPDAMICTGRSDFPNQVNNVLCFPFIFRGALDVGATGINEEMKHATVDTIAHIAPNPPSDAGT